MYKCEESFNLLGASSTSHGYIFKNLRFLICVNLWGTITEIRNKGFNQV